MGNYNVSSRYAKALLDMTTENGTFDAVSEDVILVHKAVTDSKDLRHLLVSPIIREEKKISILGEIFQTRISAETMKFIKFVVTKNREYMLGDIMKRYLDLRNDKLGILEVEVISSSEFSSQQKINLEAKLKERTKKNVMLSYRIDENIIGGFRLRLKDTVIDASVQHQLELLRKSFLGEKLISTN